MSCCKCVLHPIDANALPTTANPPDSPLLDFHVGILTYLNARCIAGALPISSSSSYAITGGLGALGMLMANWACQQAADLFVSLFSRGGRAGMQPALNPLLGTGCRGLVTICMADVSCHADTPMVLQLQDRVPSTNLLHAGAGSPLNTRIA